MLVACLTVSIVSIATSDIVRPHYNEGDDMYWSTIMPNGLAGLWTITIVSIAIAIELIFGLFNCLNARYCYGDCIVFSRVLVRVIIYYVASFRHHSFRIFFGTLYLLLQC